MRCVLAFVVLLCVGGSSLLADEPAKPAEVRVAREKAIENSIGMKFVPIPAGTFTMGSPFGEKDRYHNERQHQVTLTKSSYMGRTEVTQGQWKKVMGTEPWKGQDYVQERDDYPAVYISWDDAVEFCKKLSAMENRVYRLPTEAEWEYACRAGTTTAWSFGADVGALGDYAWFAGNTEGSGTRVVRQKKPNPFGLYDMHGNVAEWCIDQYAPNLGVLAGLGSDDPFVKSKTPYPHVAKGGSWDDDAKRLRSAARRGSDKSWKMQDPQLPKSIWYLTDAQFLGFRIVRPLKVPTPEEARAYWNSGVEKE